MIAEILLMTISGVFFFYSIICSGYNLLFAIASKFYKNIHSTEKSSQVSFLVLIPAYKEDGIILDSVQKNLASINYPKHQFKLMVIADQLRKETISSLNSLGDSVEVHEVSFEKSTKVKSLNSAINTHANSGYDYIVVLDADNVVHPEFLSNINASIQNGYIAIQGRRTAKNKNNSLSILDGLSEEINNSIFRKGGNALGFSSPISGSGMAYEYSLLQEILASESALGGFDKMLQIRILERKIKIRFCENAIVYDEKTDNKAVFQNQRKRWLNSHFVYFARFAGNGIKGLLKLNFDLFNLAIFIHGLLPRSFNAIIIGFLLFVSVLTPDIYFLNFYHWLLIFLSFVTANVLAIPREYWNVNLLKAIASLPSTLFNMLLALTKIKESNKSFIHTPHKKHNQ